MTGRRGMRSVFSIEDIELMLTIRVEEEERARKAGRKSARDGQAAKPPATEPASDRAKRQGTGATLSDGDLELLRILRLRMEKSAPKAAPPSSASKRAAKPTAAEPPPDRRTVSRKKKAGDAS